MRGVFFPPYKIDKYKSYCLVSIAARHRIKNAKNTSQAPRMTGRFGRASVFFPEGHGRSNQHGPVPLGRMLLLSSLIIAVIGYCLKVERPSL